MMLFKGSVIMTGKCPVRTSIRFRLTSLCFN